MSTRRLDRAFLAHSGERKFISAYALTCAQMQEARLGAVRVAGTGTLYVDARPDCRADYDRRMGGITRVGYTRLWATDGARLALHLPIAAAVQAGRVDLPAWTGIDADEWGLPRLAVPRAGNVTAVRSIRDALISDAFRGEVAMQSFYEACPSCLSKRVASIGRWASEHPDRRVVALTCGGPKMASRFVYERAWQIPVFALSAGDDSADAMEACWGQVPALQYTSDQLYMVNGTSDTSWPHPYESCRFRGIPTPWDHWETWKPPSIRRCMNLDGTHGDQQPDQGQYKPPFP